MISCPPGVPSPGGMEGHSFLQPEGKNRPEERQGVAKVPPFIGLVLCADHFLPARCLGHHNTHRDQYSNFIPILPMRSLRPQEVKGHAENHPQMGV